eukprot:TRINITY_DN7658_c1_g3_i2.p1 TRINITY_DN7658_c1_g3~~TRINITY_DN7658_c1_g3_i2.p1  ORF type:complete len:545 (+),score=129.76 TRINITY_DN7658_c1_g3_i2:810-2444(+)
MSGRTKGSFQLESFTIAALVIVFLPPLWPIAVCVVILAFAWRRVKYLVDLGLLQWNLYLQPDNIRIHQPSRMADEHLNMIWASLPDSCVVLQVKNQDLSKLSEASLMKWSFGPGAASLRSIELQSCNVNRRFFSFFSAMNHLHSLTINGDTVFVNSADTFRGMMNCLSNCKQLTTLRIELNDAELPDNIFIHQIDEVAKFTTSRQDPRGLNLTFGCKIPVADIADHTQKVLVITGESELNRLGKFEASLINELVKSANASGRFELLRLGRLASESSLQCFFSQRVCDSLLAIELESANSSFLRSFKEAMHRVLSSEGNVLPRLVRVSPEIDDASLEKLLCRNRTLRSATLEQDSGNRSKSHLRLDQAGLVSIQSHGIFGKKKETIFPWKDLSLLFQDDTNFACFRTPSGQVLVECELNELVKRLIFLSREPVCEIARLLNSFHWTFCESSLVRSTLERVESSLLRVDASGAIDSEEGKSVDYLRDPEARLVELSFTQIVNFELDLRETINRLGFEEFFIREDNPRLHKLLKIRRSLNEPNAPDL